MHKSLKLVLSVWALTIFAAALQDDVAQAARVSDEKRDRTVHHKSPPRVIRFSGVLSQTEDSLPRRGVVALTFTMYSEPQGGSPVWVETQNVNLDGTGRYTAMLGESSGEGMPISLFASGEARWLGVRVAEEGAAEQPRVQLVSVPYALAAIDAQSLAGRPATDYQLTRRAMETASDASAAGLEPTAPISNGAQDGIPNRVARFDGATTIAPSSLIFDNGSNVGIGTDTPTALFHVNAVAGDAFNLYTSTTSGGSVAVYANHSGATPIGYAGFFTKSGAGTTNIGLYAEATGATNNYAAIFQGGNVGIGTGAPLQKLQVAGTIYSTTGGFKFPDGTTQTTAATGGGVGDITAVTAGTGLSGGGLSGDVSLAVNPGVVQSRVTGTCGAGQYVRIIAQDGSVTCGTDASGGSGGGPATFTGNNGTQIVYATQAGSSASFPSLSNPPPSAVRGDATATSNYAAGVIGGAFSPNGYGVLGANFASSGDSFGVVGLAGTSPDGTGVLGQADATSGITTGVWGLVSSTSGTAVYGLAVATSGPAWGVEGVTSSAAGYGGVFRNSANGNILRGGNASAWVFRVDGTGKGFFNGGTQVGGADFAESVEVSNSGSKYEPGDVVVISNQGDRQVELSDGAYSTSVAGVFSTKPGVLATRHGMDDPRIVSEIPVAVIGIVPCKVTDEGGPIARGDLLVTSSTPGYAMKGTNRGKMLGAIVGKAMQPLKSGRGTIEILITLQ